MLRSPDCGRRVMVFTGFSFGISCFQTFHSTLLCFAVPFSAALDTRASSGDLFRTLTIPSLNQICMLQTTVIGILRWPIDKHRRSGTFGFRIVFFCLYENRCNTIRASTTRNVYLTVTCTFVEKMQNDSNCKH